MKLGKATADNVEPSLRLLDHVEAGTLVPLWSRDWKLDRRLVKAIRERGGEVVVYLESTGYSYAHILAGEYDCDIRLLASRADGCVVRWDQEANGEGLGADWQDIDSEMYVETFHYVHDLMRSEADVRLFWCAAGGDPNAMQWYPGDAHCEIVGFDRYSWKEDSKFPPDQWRKDIEMLRTTRKPIWVGECGRKAGLTRRAEWLRSILETGVDAAVVFDMEVPEFEHSWTWNRAMRNAWREMLTT